MGLKLYHILFAEYSIAFSRPANSLPTCRQLTASSLPTRCQLAIIHNLLQVINILYIFFLSKTVNSCNFLIFERFLCRQSQNLNNFDHKKYGACRRTDYESDRHAPFFFLQAINVTEAAHCFLSAEIAEIGKPDNTGLACRQDSLQGSRQDICLYAFICDSSRLSRSRPFRALIC